MPQFRKRAVVIEAVQFTGENISEVWEAFTAENVYGPVEGQPNAFIETLEGRMTCKPGDWIIRGVEGELYPCKPDIFKKTYEPA